MPSAAFMLMIGDVEPLARQAREGCLVDHLNTVDMLCDSCAWHEHECPKCHYVWDHDARLAAQDEAAYAVGHACPRCGTDQRMRRPRLQRERTLRPPRTPSPAQVRGTEIHSVLAQLDNRHRAMDIIEMMALFEEVLGVEDAPYDSRY